MNHNRYCLPLQKAEWQTIVDAINTHQHTTQFFEVWLDYVDDLNTEAIVALAESYPHRIVYLFRRADLEPPRMGSAIRRSLLAQLLSLPVLIDLDVSAQHVDLEHIGKLPRQAKLITSYHNYAKTPAEFQQIIESMRSYKPDIYKVATHCHNESDASRLMSLKAHLNAGSVKNIVVGMGDAGRLARIVCDLWGNELVFAAESAETASAPGQFTRQELEKIEALLRGLS